MVTHIPSPNGSNSSLSLTSASAAAYRPVYAHSQAGSSTVSHHQRSSSREHASRPRAPSSSSVSSQATLVASQVTSHHGRRSSSSVAGFDAGPSAYRAPSIASTSAARPRHRRSTSQSRSRRSREVEYEVPNVFPWFGQTGDVEICVQDRRNRTQKRYLLHRLILAQNSKWFERDLKQAVKSTSVDTAKSGISLHPLSDTRPVRYQLNWSKYLDAQRIPLLSQIGGVELSSVTPPRPPPLSTANKPSLPSSTFFRNPVGSGNTEAVPSEDADILTAYDNLFLSFYNHAPELSTTNIATAYVESKLLLYVASAYGAIDAVGPRIDYHLLRFGSRLWRQIAKYPPSYLKLGHLARSRAIFSEALVHVVGTWPVGQSQLQRGAQGVENAVIDLIEDKVDELEDIKLRVEARLYRINLTTGRGERVSPSTAYTDWLALSLFRQWLAENTAPAPTGILKDSPDAKAAPAGRVHPQTSPRLVRAYYTLAAGGQAYLNHDECKKFLKLRPGEYSRENLRRFERRIDEVKNLAAEIVRPLTRECLEIGGSFGYLTCARAEERDFAYVWETEQKP